MFGWFRKYVRKIGILGVEIEFHPPAEPAAHSATTTPATPVLSESVAGEANRAGTSAGRLGTSLEESAGLTFDEVIRAIHARYPDAPLGETAKQGQYFERARDLINYQMRTGDPPCYAAIQPNGNTMWLYLGRGGKICCGDKK